MHTNNLLSNNQAFNGIYRGRLLQKSKNDIRVFIPGIYNSQIKEFDLEGMIDCFPKIQWCAYNLESIDINNQDNDGKGPAMIMFENGDLQRPVVLSYVVIGGGSENQSGYYNENGNLVSGGNYTGNGTTGNANADETFKWLIYYGLNIAQAAGVMGSLRCEGAAFDPKDKHMDVNGYYSYGIAKFNSKPGYPWDQVKEFCRNNNLDPYSIKGQCAAIVHTIKKGIFGNRLVIVNGSKTRNLSSILQEGNTIEGAINSCRIFVVDYEVCAGMSIIADGASGGVQKNQDIINWVNNHNNSNTEFSASNYPGASGTSINVIKRLLFAVYYYNIFKDGKIENNEYETMNTTGNSVAKKAISWAKNHTSAQGYTYVYGANGPKSYDCSHYVYHAYKDGGGLSNLSYATTTDLYSDAWERYGFKTVTGNVQIGDVLIRKTSSSHHVDMYMGNGYVIGAHSSSTGIHGNSKYNVSNYNKIIRYSK